MNKQKVNIYVDDLRVIPKEYDFVGARSYAEAIELLEKHKGNIGILSLDHDLGIENGKELNGYHIALYLCENGITPEYCYIHSDNVVGKNAIEGLLRQAQARSFIGENMKVYKYPLVPNRYED